MSSKFAISLKITLNVFKCLKTSLVPLKILYTLTTEPFLFILVGTLSVCEFALVPGVYILLCPQEEKVHYDYTVMARSLLNWKKTQTTKKDKLFMVFVI